MNKILIWHDKYGDVYFDASENELKAFLAMFKRIDKAGYYCDISHPEKEIKELEGTIKEWKDHEEEMKNGTYPEKFSHVKLKDIPTFLKSNQEEIARLKDQNSWYKKAKRGNAQAALTLLGIRYEYEYENWTLDDVEET